MRTFFDNGIQARAGGPFLGLNLPKLLQDLQPIYQASKNLIKDQGATPTVVPTAQPRVLPPVAPVDNTSTYLWLSVLALGGAGAAWYFFRKKKPAAKK